MSYSKIKALDDFIVSVLLTKNTIEHTSSGRVLHFKLEYKKLPVFIEFISKNKLKEHIYFDIDSLKGFIKPSLSLERILRQWTQNNTVLYIDSNDIRVSSILTTAILFAKQTLEKKIVIPTSLGREQQQTLSNLVGQLMDIKIISGHHTIIIYPFSSLVLRALRERSMKECMELIDLCSYQEKEIVKRKVVKEEGEKNSYAL